MSPLSEFLHVRPRGRSAAILTVLFVLGGAALHAQDTSNPSSKPTPTPKPQAYVRFWNMLIGPDSTPLQLLATEDRLLSTSSAGDAFAGYQPLDPGTYTFTVRRPNDPNGVVKKVPVVLRADVYITLLAAAKDGKPDVQLIDDTVDPKTDDGLGRLVVRQFFPGANVTVAINAEPSGTPLAFGGATTLSSLPLRGSIVNMRATGLGPVPKNWNVEADFATGGHHATMMVVADPYGRFRPRLVFDGAAGKPLPPPTSPSGAGSRAPSPTVRP